MLLLHQNIHLREIKLYEMLKNANICKHEIINNNDSEFNKKKTTKVFI